MTTGARLLFLWGLPNDVAAFDRHYRDVHIPLAKKLPGLRRYTLSRNIVAGRGGDPFYAVAELEFDDMNALRQSSEAPEGLAAAADVANLSAHAALHSMIYELEDLESSNEEESARVALHRSVTIPVPADEVWELLSDWAGMLRWWLSAEDGGLQGPELVSCELVGEQGSVPRTRRMTLGDGTIVDETIVYQNDQTRRISYTKSDSLSVTGYVATTYIDDVASGGCTVHLAAMFDVSDPADRAATRAWFAAIYAAMFNGYRRYFCRDDAAESTPLLKELTSTPASPPRE